MAINKPGDEYEEEADLVADRMMQMEEPATADAPAQAPMLIQRACTLCEGELQRQADENDEEDLSQTKIAGDRAPLVSAGAEAQFRSLQGRGQPLPKSERVFFESRFRHDFSHVRVHTGSPGAEAAQGVQARAFTIGQDIVFGSGQYAPGTDTGRRLLAHELTHAIQQGAATPAGDRFVRPRISSLPAGCQQLSRAPDDELDEPALQAYLQLLTSTGGIEDSHNSHAKARAVVNAWRMGGSSYVLDIQRKTLMIREMQEGVTDNADERAILEILERSYNHELSVIFGPSGITASGLNADFQGAERTRLRAFFERRFHGGMAAMQGGTITPQGYPVPLGLDIERAAGAVYDLADVRAPDVELTGGQSAWNVPCVLGVLCALDPGVVSQLQGLTVRRVIEISVTQWRFESTSGSGHWISQTVHPAGFNNPGEINIRTEHPGGTVMDCDDAAQILVHEVRHRNQPAGLSRPGREREAYTYVEQWAIDRGVPPSAGSTLRYEAPNPPERTIPDPNAIAEHVRVRYGSEGSGAPGETVIGHHDTPSPTTVVQGPGGVSERPSQPGDRYNDNSTLHVIAEQPISPNAWVCPH